MADSSFDVVAEVPVQNLRNAVDAARKELATRYDFKGSKSSLELREEQKSLEVVAVGDDAFKLGQVLDVLKSKLVRQDVDLRGLDWKATPQPATQGTLRQVLAVRRGLPQDVAKRLTTAIRDSGLKVKTQIQGDAIRVSSPSKDALQETITLLRGLDVDAPLSFTNYR